MSTKQFKKIKVRFLDSVHVIKPHPRSDLVLKSWDIKQIVFVSTLTLILVHVLHMYFKNTFTTKDHHYQLPSPSILFYTNLVILMYTVLKHENTNYFHTKILSTIMRFYFVRKVLGGFVLIFLFFRNLIDWNVWSLLNVLSFKTIKISCLKINTEVKSFILIKI